MKNKLISVCIPSYNRPEELYRLLKSIDSKVKKLEIIICEDKSPKRDEINQVVKQFIDKTTFEVKYFLVT